MATKFAEIAIASGAIDAQLEFFGTPCVYRPLFGAAVSKRCKLITAPPNSIDEQPRMIGPMETIAVSDDEWDIDAIDTGGDRIDLTLNGQTVTLSIKKKTRQKNSGMTTLECG